MPSTHTNLGIEKMADGENANTWGQRTNTNWDITEDALSGKHSIALSDQNTSVVAKRIKRSEGFLFQMLYQIHKIITLIFTGKNINFGNYCCLTKSDINILIKNKSLWSSFSGSLKKHLSKLNEVNSTRGLRYFGPSKMSLLNLILHSFSIIAVFKYAVLLRSFLICILLWFLITPKINLIFVVLTLIIIFNVLIFVVSTREKEKSLKNSNEKILYIDEILQH